MQIRKDTEVKDPPKFVGKVSNNLLEFLEEVMCIWTSIIEVDMER